MTKINFVDVDTSPYINLGLFSFGIGEDSGGYSQSISNHAFQYGKTYDLGVYVYTYCEAAGLARDKTTCSWNLEEIIFED
jgi:hypothetical protein